MGFMAAVVGYDLTGCTWDGPYNFLFSHVEVFENMYVFVHREGIRNTCYTYRNTNFSNGDVSLYIDDSKEKGEFKYKVYDVKKFLADLHREYEECIEEGRYHIVHNGFKFEIKREGCRWSINLSTIYGDSHDEHYTVDKITAYTDMLKYLKEKGLIPDTLTTSYTNTCS